MATFWLNTTLGSKGQSPAGIEFNFETSEANTPEELAELLATRGVVAGERLTIESHDRSGRRVVRRQRIMLTAAAILSAQLREA